MLGGGPIGLELAQTYHRLGSTVTVLERLPEVLPREDPEVGRFVRERLEHEGIMIVTGFAAERVTCEARDRKSTRLNSSHLVISYAVFCLKKKKKIRQRMS